MTATSPAAPASGKSSPIERLFVGTLALLGFGIGTRPIGDNSMLVHLRTGIDIAHGLGIPRRDPYSFTAHGSRWVVQSWLASFAYGWVERLAGDAGLLLLMGAITGVTTLLVARLAVTGRPLRTAAATLVALGVGAPSWSPRPLLIGLLCLAATILVADRGRRPWLLVPIAWVWVNSHGSFPLGAAWLVVAALGAAVDGRGIPRARIRSGLWFAVGLAVACINPLGPRLLLFPLSIGQRRPVFQQIVEWRSPSFQTSQGLLVAGAVAVALVVLTRRRAPWVDALPVALFLVAALVAQRNLPALGIVLAPALGRALRPAPRAIEAERPSSPFGPVADGAAAAMPQARRGLDRVGLAALLAGAAVVTIAALSRPALTLEGYPVAVVERGERSGLLAPDRHAAVQDVVGCYLILRRGRSAQVFVDDRYDMYPLQVGLDSVTLTRGGVGSIDVLTRRGITTVLWRRDLALTDILRRAGWVEADGDRRWVVLTAPS